MPSGPLRVASFSGFYGDRSTALAEMLRGSDAQVLVGDYLAEVTMSVLAAQRTRDPDAGHASGFLAQLRGVRDEFLASDRRIVVNAGGLNPEAMARAIRTLAPELSVSTVSGDDVMDRLSELAITPPFEPRTANAYLGGWGIARALDDNARVVVCGRVADASLVVGAAAWWHGWRRTDWNALAGAVVAGHLIECGTQVTGGNLSSFEDLDLDDLSFPIAEVDRDGTSRISKLPGSGDAVSLDTVTAQLVYEIQGRWYANPDVSVDLASVTLQHDGDDVVTVSSVEGAPPPATTKVAVTGVDGWENSIWVGLTGHGFTAKRRVFERALRSAMDDVPGVDVLHVSLIGREVDQPASQDEATGFLRVVAHGRDEGAVGRRLSSAVVELALASFPGIYLTAPPSRGHQRGAYSPSAIMQAALDHVVIDHHGRRRAIAAPEVTGDLRIEFDPQEATPPVDRETPELLEVSLGQLVRTRSGDKGGNANLGVWVDSDERWSWLTGWLTIARLRELLPEADGLTISRISLPRIRALNFVIDGLLGDGAISSLRLDSQAKGLGEFISARRVEAPASIATPQRAQVAHH